jgi:hypothetical protein
MYIDYLMATLESASHITNDLHGAGIRDWFIHVLSKDEVGLRKMKIHSSNYLEQLDILRFGIIAIVKATMHAKHQEAELVAEDENFYNPLTGLKRV